MKYVITGHGQFAPGLLSAFEMIGGANSSVVAVPFVSENASEFAAKLEQAITDAEKDSDSGVVVFTDLMGGTPFNTAMVCALKHADVEVVAGTNLPMLLECILASDSTDNAQSIAAKAVESGSAGVVNGKEALSNAADGDDGEEGDGI